MHILHLDSAITGEDSVSRKLTAQIVARLKAADPDATVTYRDLNAGIPIIDTPWYQAVRKGTDTPDAEQQQRIATADAILAQVQDADTLVIGLPVYNFMAPATLKTWLDQIARAGITFRYSETGPEGLLKGKRAIVAYTAAGTPIGSDLDFASGYLRHMLGFIGITDVTFVPADGLAMDRPAAMARAEAALDKIAA